MRLVPGSLLLLLLAPAVTATAAPLDELQGRWTLLSTEQPGGTCAARQPQVLVIDKDRWTMEGAEGQGVIVLDPAEPAHLDWSYVGTDGRPGRTAPCLYRVEGDTLRICRFPASPGPRRRPARLAAKHGAIVMTFRRER